MRNPFRFFSPFSRPIITFFLCWVRKRRKETEKEKKLANPFAGKRQAKMLKFFSFLLSNQCVAWYMSDIIAFKNIIFSLNVKWMSVQARHEYRRAWDGGMAAEISFVEICAKTGNKKLLLHSFLEKHTPCHHMMYVEKSPFSGNERWHNVCHTYERHIFVWIIWN